MGQGMAFWKATMFTLTEELLSDLRARYAEPHRSYHGQRHIDALLKQSRGPRMAWHDPVAVELAIWFHDAVYQPGARDNERRSEQLLRQSLSGPLAPAVLERAAAMILATEKHRIPAGLPVDLTEDMAAFLDMDISILGADEAEYALYALGVEREFLPMLGESVWLEGRAAFLRASLEKPTPLFHTATARATLEEPARANMRRELAGLNGRRPGEPTH
jgi:predicted metal-dependent HD superfamily phosphohydrolase